MTKASTKQDESPLRTESNRPPDGADAYVVAEGDTADSATLTCTVVHALAAATHLDTRQAQMAVYDRVDTDALDAIFAPKSSGDARAGAQVAFDLASPDVRVTAMASGAVRIDFRGGAL